MSVSINNDLYKIVNVQYQDPSLAVGLVNGVDGFVGGFYNIDPDYSDYLQWEVKNGIPGQFTLANHAIETYASLEETYNGIQLVGNPSDPTLWTVAPTDVEGGYLVSTFDSPFVWTLKDSFNGSGIALNPVAEPQQNNQVWKFVPVN